MLDIDHFKYVDIFAAIFKMPFCVSGWLLGFLIILIVYYFWNRFSSSDLPPGPRGYPLIGYLPFICHGITHLHFDKLAQKYGDVFSFRAGRKLVVVLNSYDAIRAALTDQAKIFTGRPTMDILRENELPGIFQSEGKICQDYKRSSLGILKDFGFGKSSLEPYVMREVECVLKFLEDSQMKPIYLSTILRPSFANIIMSVLFNTRLDYDDKRLQTLLYYLKEFLGHNIAFNMEFFIPKWILKIPLVAKWTGHESNTEYADQLLDELTKLTEERLANSESGECNDFVSTYMNQKEVSNVKAEQSVEHLSHIVRSMFNPGTDTLATSVLWLILYLIEHPSVQTRMQKEIDQVVGHERMPSLTDLKDLPFVEATLMESHRMGSILPLSNRCNIRETTLKGYRIPNRTIIFINIWSVHQDPKTYQEPEKFRPERFLDESGNVKKPVTFIPFSIGSRQCVGASYSNTAIFLYMASLLQRFTFVKPDGDQLSFDYSRTIVRTPKPYRVIAVPRQLQQK